MMISKGKLLKIKDGKVVDDREIDFAQLYNMGKTQLEKQTIYLMKKRVSLEDAIMTLQKKLNGAINAVKNRERMLEEKTSQLEAHKRLLNEQLERINRENNVTLTELIAENVRLTNENSELKRSVSIG